MTDAEPRAPADDRVPGEAGIAPRPARNVQKEGEIGGPKGPEPTRYGDWESNGRCTDF